MNVWRALAFTPAVQMRSTPFCSLHVSCLAVVNLSSLKADDGAKPQVKFLAEASVGRS